MNSLKPSKAALRALGVDADHLDEMQRKINQLERENDAVALTRVRHEISGHLVAIRLLLRDGHTKNMNRHGERVKESFKP